MSTVETATPEMVAAAWLHDIVEDTDVSPAAVFQAFGAGVAKCVDGMTKRDYPDVPRAGRKHLERTRLSELGWEVQTIKQADIISNTPSVALWDPDFARLYLHEQSRLASRLIHGRLTKVTSAALSFAHAILAQHLS